MRWQQWSLAAFGAAALAALSLPSGGGGLPLPPAGGGDEPVRRVAERVAQRPASAAASPAQTGAARVSGEPATRLVVDLSWRPVSGAAVVTREGHRVLSGPDGAVDGEPLGVVPGRGLVAVDSPLLALCAGDRRALVVAPAGCVHGRVVTADGAAAADVELAVEVTVELPVELPAGALVRAVHVRGPWRTWSDAGGWFTLPASPMGLGARLVARHPDFADVSEPLDGDLVHARSVVLRRPAADAQRLGRSSAFVRAPAARIAADEAPRSGIGRVAGRVLDRHGAPVAGAVVGLLRPSAWALEGEAAMHLASRVVADARGGFELDAGQLAASELGVAGAGVVPMRLPLPAAGLDELVVRVERRSWLWFAGVIRGAELAGAEVAALDERGRAAPVWSAPNALALSSSMLVAALGVDASARELIVRAGERELGRLRLRR
ncbi:MAG: hypothetical protein AB7O97_04930 [Planctomycetota bacterium]